MAKNQIRKAGIIRYLLFSCFLIQGFHCGDFTGDIVIPLFILLFPDFVNPKRFHYRKQPIIIWHNFISFVVKSVVKFRRCLLCQTKKHILFIIFPPTPPPPSNDSLATLMMASTFIFVISFLTISSGMSYSLFQSNANHQII